MRYMVNRLAIPLFFMVFLSSCYSVHDNPNKPVLSNEQIDIETTAKEMRLWQTNDLSIQYNLLDHGDSFSLNGFVSVKDSVTYSFPRTDFLIIYVYLLDSEGVATSRHTIRPRVSKYNPFPRKSKFSKDIVKDTDTSSFAFGYFGNFFDIENGGIGGRLGRIGTSHIGWEIYHSPF